MIIGPLSSECGLSRPLKLAPLRIELWRGHVLESKHLVHAALVNVHGALLMSAGDPDMITTARSSLKPFQLWPTLNDLVWLQRTSHSCAPHTIESLCIPNVAKSFSINSIKTKTHENVGRTYPIIRIQPTP